MLVKCRFLGSRSALLIQIPWGGGLEILVLTDAPGEVFLKGKLETFAIQNIQKIENLKFSMKELWVPWSLLSSWCSIDTREPRASKCTWLKLGTYWITKRQSLHALYQCITILLHIHWWTGVFLKFESHITAVLCIHHSKPKLLESLRWETWVWMILRERSCQEISVFALVPLPASC